MKIILTSFAATVVVFFIAVWGIAPILGLAGYDSVASTYDRVTHALLLALMFVVILSAQAVVRVLTEQDTIASIDEAGAATAPRPHAASRRQDGPSTKE